MSTNRYQSESENDEVYDEIDKFHQEEDKRILKNFNKKTARDTKEEVLGVYESESELSDSSDDSIIENNSKNQTQEIEVTTDAWGKNRSEFYGTYADEDYGNWDDERDEQLALEEEDAIRRQKKLDAGLKNVDFTAFLESDEEEDLDKNDEHQKVDEKTVTIGTVDYFIKHSSSLPSLMTEYNERSKTFEKLKPILKDILKVMENSNVENNLKTQVKMILSTYSYYLRNLAMFFYIKDVTPVEKFKSTENHPVLDDIMRIHPILKKIDLFVNNRLPLLKRVAAKLKQNPDDANKITAEICVKKRRVSLENNGEDEIIGEDEMDVDGEDERKRKITYEMQKNRGLTVKRKKGTTHSRIKKRLQYKKALLRRRSQVPEVRKEVTKYDGEKRGIRASTVRSIKLKA